MPARTRSKHLRQAAVRHRAFVEIGPGTTLTSMAKRAVQNIALHNVATPTDVPLPLLENR